MIKSIFTAIVAVSFFSGFQANAEQGTAKAKMKVVNALVVTRDSDLLFAEAAAGASEETVVPDSVETAQNASFTVQGEPNMAISVSLPQDGSVNMTGAGDQIPVNQFTSNNPTQLDGSGAAALYVGATRSALSATQAAGEYEGDFVVDVVYQ